MTIRINLNQLEELTEMVKGKSGKKFKKKKQKQKNEYPKRDLFSKVKKRRMQGFSRKK